ncbi:hypothetical protein DAPPUDRAFT_251889 [Daphnia pulex]|uniref:Uncharacterized protein n=1 Tax=Daphnia pulex TaxID=6669 RepID=E9H1L6_DAPPU|nr:hypothetical protein DAPPUDRAFT_251889 [Daphnia pulex]|eukprot:EFX74376.1 hypothetical protein DAPPUDRAFT_251889 [Daphnia pulex]
MIFIKSDLCTSTTDISLLWQCKKLAKADTDIAFFLVGGQTEATMAEFDEKNLMKIMKASFRHLQVFLSNTMHIKLNII